MLFSGMVKTGVKFSLLLVAGAIFTACGPLGFNHKMGSSIPMADGANPAVNPNDEDESHGLA